LRLAHVREAQYGCVVTNDLTPAQREWGTRLRDARVARKLTQAQVAEAAKLDVSTVSRVEAGQIGFGGAYLRIAAALGVTVEVTAP
jgi:transcriptional regulator with XRE-family HTH domain